jgi:hypothetical protein
MSVLPTYGPVRRRILTPYVVIWIAVASLATTYLALLGLRPEFFAHSASAGPDVEQQLTQTRRDMSRAFADLDPLRRTVGEMKLDVANLKIAANEGVARDNELADRLGALETSAAPKRPEVVRLGEATTDSAPAPQAAPPAPARDPRRAAVKTPEDAPPAAVAPLSQGQPKDAKLINGAKKQDKQAQAKQAQAKQAQVVTGSIAKPAKVQPKAKAAAKPGAVGVLLATGPSVDALRLNWSILTDRHGDSVKNLQPRYIVSGKPDQRVYSLLAGPVASTAQAKSLCQSMAQKGLACEVSAFRGNAL